MKSGELVSLLLVVTILFMSPVTSVSIFNNVMLSEYPTITQAEVQHLKEFVLLYKNGENDLHGYSSFGLP